MEGDEIDDLQEHAPERYDPLDTWPADIIARAVRVVRKLREKLGGKPEGEWVAFDPRAEDVQAIEAAWRSGLVRVGVAVNGRGETLHVAAPGRAPEVTQ